MVGWPWYNAELPHLCMPLVLSCAGSGVLGIEAPLEAIGRLELPSFMGSTLPVGPGSVEPETPLASATLSKQGRKEEREKKEDPPSS